MPLKTGGSKDKLKKKESDIDPTANVNNNVDANSFKRNEKSIPPGSNKNPAPTSGVTPQRNTSHSSVQRPRLVFHCQQAQGSPTGVISDFTNVKELYKKISDAYDLAPNMILFCTLNTHKVDMTKLLGGQLGLDDFIFAHIRGQPKVVDVDKTDEQLGLTITDNGAGLAFIKGIKEHSVIGEIPGIKVGDHIEKVNDISMIGSRHFEVAKALKEIPKGATFSMRLIEPLKSGFSEIGQRSSEGGSKKGGVGTGKATIRLKKGGAIEQVDETANAATEKINSLLESFLGISDSELAQTIWEVGSQIDNPSSFTTAIEESDLKVFNFSESLIFDLWGAITDAKQGRLKKKQDFQMNL